MQPQSSVGYSAAALRNLVQTQNTTIARARGRARGAASGRTRSVRCNMRTRPPSSPQIPHLQAHTHTETTIRVGEDTLKGIKRASLQIVSVLSAETASRESFRHDILSLLTKDSEERNKFNDCAKKCMEDALSCLQTMRYAASSSGSARCSENQNEIDQVSMSQINLRILENVESLYLAL